MPPDVFLVLASSGISLVASLMYLVTPQRERPEPQGPQVPFCLPPVWPRHRPPPLPRSKECAVVWANASARTVMVLKPVSGEWLISVESSPLTDSAGLQLHGDRAHGTVADLRWHGQAGLARPIRSSYRVKPGKA